MSVLQAVEAIRPDIAGIMGAFGAALIAKERYHAEGRETTMLSIDKINELNLHHIHGQLSRMYQQLPSYHQQIHRRTPVLLAVTAVSAVSARKRIKITFRTCYEYKYKRLFSYEPLSEEQATRGKVQEFRVY